VLIGIALGGGEQSPGNEARVCVRVYAHVRARGDACASDPFVMWCAQTVQSGASMSPDDSDFSGDVAPSVLDGPVPGAGWAAPLHASGARGVACMHSVCIESGMCGPAARAASPHSDAATQKHTHVAARTAGQAHAEAAAAPAATSKAVCTRVRYCVIGGSACARARVLRPPRACAYAMRVCDTSPARRRSRLRCARRTRRRQRRRGR
jgi:hypothetical protein